MHHNHRSLSVMSLRPIYVKVIYDVNKWDLHKFNQKITEIM